MENSDVFGMSDGVEYDIAIISGISENPGAELSFFKKEYEEQYENKDYMNKLFEYVTHYVNGEYDVTHTKRFIIDLHLGYFNVKFLEDWIEYISKNFDPAVNYILLVKLLTNVKSSVDWITKIEGGSKEEKESIRCAITSKIWSCEYFRKLIKNSPKLKSGYEYIDKGIFCSFFNKNEWYDNISIVTKYLKPIINDKSIHEDLLRNIKDMLDVNVAYTLNNHELIDSKDCAPIWFTTFLLNLLLEIVDSYTTSEKCGFDFMIDEILSDPNKYKIEEYKIENIPFFHKLYVLIAYGAIIAHIPLFKIYHRLNNDLRKHDLLPPYLGLSRENKKNINMYLKRITSLLGEDNTQIKKMFGTYGTIYKHIDINEFFNEFLTYVDYATSVPSKIYNKLGDDMYELTSNILGGMNGAIGNKHVRYYAAEIILKLTPKTGFQPFGNILENIFNYLNEVDFFKWSMISRAVEHHKSIQQLLIMVLDNYVEKPIDDELDKNISGTLFNLIKSALDMYVHMKDIIDSLITMQGGNVSVIPKSVVEVCNSLMLNVIFTLGIAKRIYSSNLITRPHPELERELAIFIINNIEKLSRGTHQLYEVVKGIDLARDILKLTYELLTVHLTDDMMQYMIDDIELIIEESKGAKIDDIEKTVINTKMSEYSDNFKKELDYPHEFLDPISCCVIKDPVMLPQTHNICDRLTVKMQLLHDPVNPYTREPLTEKILNEYNETPEVKELISKFIEKKKKWEMDQQHI